MIPAKPFFFVCGVLIAMVISTGAQEINPPPRPESRIHDEGSLFELGEPSQIAGEIRKRLDRLQSETGCDILIATVTTATGTSLPILADQFAATWLESEQRGAVLVYERAGGRLAISATESVRESVADYTLAAIEQSLSGSREGIAPAEAVSLAAGDLAALFRKNFGSDAGREHPSIKADRILMAVVTACIIGLITVVATLHWRGEKARV